MKKQQDLHGAERYDRAAALLAEAATQQGADDHGLAKLSGADGQWCATMVWSTSDRLFTINLGSATGYASNPDEAVEDCLRHVPNRRDKARRTALTLAAQYDHQSGMLRKRLLSL
ncbi:MAG: hypothetical protein RL077_339 [Verrucomicrobiota bacterium]|jgi:hypothetical protein